MPARWTAAVGAGLRALLWRRARRLSDERWWATNTRRVQAEQLRGLLHRAAGTEIGRERGFARLADLPAGELPGAYRGAVPTVEYEDLRATAARMREGAEPDVLWPGVVMDWAETSGTTGGQKFIPVSAAMMRSNHKAALDIFAHAARMGVSLPGLFGGRVVFLGGRRI
jgi:hypothetical protein